MVDHDLRPKPVLVETTETHPLSVKIEQANYEMTLLRMTPIEKRFIRWLKINEDICPGFDNAFIVYSQESYLPGLVVGTNMHEHGHIFNHSELMKNSRENITSCYSIRDNGSQLIQVNDLSRIRPQGIVEEGSVCYLTFGEIEDFEGSSWRGRQENQKFEILGPNYKRVLLTK